MIDHISIGVTDLERASSFYEQVLNPLGQVKLISKPGTVGFGKNYPEFWLNARSGRLPGADSGFHVCLRARSAEAVKAFYAAALAAGASPDGEPGFRPQYTASYFAAFIRDADGNRIEVVTFVDELAT